MSLKPAADHNCIVLMWQNRPATHRTMGSFSGTVTQCGQFAIVCLFVCFKKGISCDAAAGLLSQQAAVIAIA